MPKPSATDKTFTVTYNFDSLESIASFMEKRAKETRDKTSGWNPRALDSIRAFAEAATWEAAAHLVRNSRIG